MELRMKEWSMSTVFEHCILYVHVAKGKILYLELSGSAQSLQ